MDNKSLEMLEFPRIREILAGYAAFSASRELALSLTPERNYEEISLRLRQTAEARRLLVYEHGFSIGSVTDIRDKARLAALEGILDPLSLLEIQQTLSALHELFRYLKSIAEEYPLIWETVSGITELRQVEKDILDSLDPSGEVLDTASPGLSAIRHQLRETRGQILSHLEGIVRSPRGNRILQEDVITERDGRYVVLVKMENRHDFKGIVHDISNTGATVFMEPTATVGLGNALRELVVEERHEVEKILRLLTAEVGAHAEDIANSIELVAELDFIMAKARYAQRINAAEPEIIEPDVIAQARGQHTSLIKLVDARHPLIGGKAVPFSLELGSDFTGLIITGPNTGGKTVTLKTVGLLCLMAQSGLPIPAAPGSRLTLFDGIFADIGDEQSIEQTLSTFSWHMSNTVRIIKSATGRSLVLLDELGTSTDPAEGSALARAILRYFLARGTLTVATTHYSDLKAFAHTTPGLQNASLEFDSETLAPTYRLSVGVPGGSNAISTAARLGIPSEIIQDARGMLSGSSHELEALLAGLMAEKQHAEALSRDLVAERAEFQRRSSELDGELQRLKTEERKAIQDARDAIVREAAELHREIRQAAAELRKVKTTEGLEKARRGLSTVREKLDTELWKPRIAETPEAESDVIKPGDTVRVREAGLVATVLSISEDTGEIEVQAGRTKLRLGLASVSKVAALPDTGYARVQPAGRAVARQLDLRGKRADEVEPLLDSYLDEAACADMPEVRIIHGIATGTVRNIVRDFLASHPLVKSFRSGERDEGGDGATVVRL